MFRYADLTVNDRNPIKRNLQRIRIRHALKPLKNLPSDYTGSILDFGAGDAYLSHQIATIYPHANIIAFEPSGELRQQALENIENHSNITIHEKLDNQTFNKFDYIFCLEVMEHLPQREMDIALEQLREVSTGSTKILFGVPNEIYLAAFLKGIFRMTRRYGEVDAIPSNILKASLGLPLKCRPVNIFSEDLPYIIRHVGFDYRVFLNQLLDKFDVVQIYGSPFPFLPQILNFEIFILAKISS
ncbi:MAG: class I SAM-dependent methyltransferase [Calditrichota bacterium]|jgi:hypothetical protein